MSAIFDNVKRVAVSGFPQGMVGNCFIYNLSFSQNYSSAASKLTIGLVPENPSVINLPGVSLDLPYDVTIDGVVVFRGYIMSKSVDESEQRKTIRLTLVDKSIRLDQYAIGLVRRHGHGNKEEDSASLEVTCNDCKDPTVNHKVQVKGPGMDVYTGPRWNGNVLCIGKEEPGQNSEDVLDVNYDQDDFKQGMAIVGSKLGFAGLSTAPPPPMKKNYVGPIREVLNSACSDAAMSFYYDSSSNDIEFFNIDAGLDVPEDKINAFKNRNDVVIKSIKSSESYEGTFANHFAARFAMAGSPWQENERTWTEYRTERNFLANMWGGYAAYGAIAKASSDLALFMYFIDHGMSAGGAFDVWSWMALGGGAGYVEGNPYDEEVVYYSSDNSEITSVSSPGWYGVARALGIEPSELRNIFFSRPAIQYGANIYAVEMCNGCSDELTKAFACSVSNYGKYYQANVSPQDLERHYQQVGCNIRKLSQTPEPTFVKPHNSCQEAIVGGPRYDPEPAGGGGGWYFQGNGEWWTNGVQASDSLSYVQPMTTPITEAIRNKQNIPEKYTHLLWVPWNEINSIVSNGNCEGTTLQYSNQGAGANAILGYTYEGESIPNDLYNCPGVPYLSSWETAPIRRCSPNDANEVEDACTQFAEACNERPQMEGMVCPWTSDCWAVNIEGNNIVIESPYMADHYISNVAIEYTRVSTEKEKKEESLNVCAADGHDFMQIKISDTDITQASYVPERVRAGVTNLNDPRHSKDTLVTNAMRANCDTHTKPIDSWSISFVGFPDDMATLLAPRGIGSYNVNFGENGISVDIEYADKPAKSPTADYFNSKMWNTRRYNT